MTALLLILEITGKFRGLQKMEEINEQNNNTTQSEIQNESFVFFKSMFEAVEYIPKAELRAQAYKTIALYGLCGIVPQEDASPYIKMIFAQAKVILDNSRNRHNACKENGRKGGAPKGNQNAKKQAKTTKETTSDTTRETSKNNLNKNKNKNKNKNENKNILERNKQREKQTEFVKSLSQKFNKIKINVENIDSEKYDLEKLIQAISKSNYLQSAPLSFILKNYTKVINGEYDNITPTDPKQEFLKHNYTREELNNIFDDLDKIEI